MRNLGIIFLIFCFVNTFAQDEILEKVQKLVDSKKYESALKLLDEIDPDNLNPDIVIKKSDIFLNYFVSSIMHQMFALKDLEENEDLMQIRGSEGNFAMFTFPIDSIIINLIEKNPNNFKLHKTLGNFYHEIHLKYPDRWFIEDAEVIKQFTDNYKIAYENGIFDYWSLYGIGYSCLLNQDYESSVMYLEKSTELNNNYPSSYYNLAYAYLYLDKRENAIENAIKAFNLYEIPDYKADAARMIAVIYNELDNKEKSLEYYNISNEIQPNNYYTLKPLLSLELILNLDSYKKRTNEFILLAPENPTIYQNLMEVYWQSNKQDELIDFFKNQINTFNGENIILGNLYFYIASIYYDKEECQLSKSNFEKSKEIFAKVFNKEHDVFKAIDSYLNEIK